MQDEDGQILEAHSISAGLDYPGSGPEHAWLRDRGRARYLAIDDEQALAAFAQTARLEGIIPALESAHALAWVLENPGSELDLVCLSGRGDKDLAEALARLQRPRLSSLRRPASDDGTERIAEAFARARANGRRAALMPYLMGGYPDLERSREIGLAYAHAGADLVELGVPFSDPLADGPVIHAAGDLGARRRGHAAGRARAGAGDRAAGSGDPHVLRQRDPRPRARAVPRRAGRGRGQRPDRPRSAARGVRRPRFRRATRGGWPWCRSSHPPPPSSGWRGSAPRARGFLYTVLVTGTTGERDGVDGGLEAIVRRAAAHTDVPVAVGFGIGTPEQASRAADAGADGVIVGQPAGARRGRARDPVAAVTELRLGRRQRRRALAGSDGIDGEKHNITRRWA